MKRQVLKKFGNVAVWALLTTAAVQAQTTVGSSVESAYTPVLSGTFGYIHNVNGGAPALEPQIETVLLVPFSSHVLLESRAEFFGFFTRENQTTGPFTGKVFKSVDYAQVDWFATAHVTATAGSYLLPFGLYNERLAPLWIRNLQDTPITDAVGTRPNGVGLGGMLRGNAKATALYSIQYSAYFSARSNVNQLEASRLAGGDGSIYWRPARLEIGQSFQHLLQQRETSSVASYVSWQPQKLPIDLKAEYDRNFNGQGYWIEPAIRFAQPSATPAFLRRLQFVPRMQQFYPLHGGGNSLPTRSTQRFDFGINYYLRDNMRFVSSYGRQFTRQLDANIWNVGFTYRFIWPLWPGRK